MIRLALPVLLFTLPAAAQDGEVVLDDIRYLVKVTEVTLEDEAAANLLTIHAEAEDGAALAVILGPYGDDLPDSAQIEWRGNETAYAANADTGGQIALTEMILNDGSLSFTFGGLVVPVEIIPGGALAPIEAGQGIDISGHLKNVALPD